MGQSKLSCEVMTFEMDAQTSYINHAACYHAPCPYRSRPIRWQWMLSSTWRAGRTSGSRQPSGYSPSTWRVARTSGSTYLSGACSQVPEGQAKCLTNNKLALMSLEDRKNFRHPELLLNRDNFYDREDNNLTANRLLRDLTNPVSTRIIRE